eukprot:13833007-Ditylum_brightwellii.AAC.1
MHLIVYGQCAKVMRTKLKAEDDFDEAAINSETIVFLVLIRAVSMGYEYQQYPVRAIHQVA